MDYETTIKNEETSETSNGDTQLLKMMRPEEHPMGTQKKIQEILICQSSTCLKCVQDQFSSSSCKALSD